VTWTYSGNPGSTPKDAVRFLIGDTDKDDQLLQDGEVAWVLGMFNNTPANAAIYCCDHIISKFSRMADESVGQVRISYSQKSKAYRELRKDLVYRLATTDMTPYAGGLSVSDEIVTDSNIDRVKPDFTKHMMENNQISPWVTGALKTYLQNGG
jgi:hypothetical protein